jgi:hypothetical protein
MEENKTEKTITEVVPAAVIGEAVVVPLNEVPLPVKEKRVSTAFKKKVPRQIAIVEKGGSGFKQEVINKPKFGGKQEGAGPKGDAVNAALGNILAPDGSNTREVFKTKKKLAYNSVDKMQAGLENIIKAAQKKINMDDVKAKDLKDLYVAYGIALTKKSELELGIKEDDMKGIEDESDLDSKRDSVINELVIIMRKKSRVQ